MQEKVCSPVILIRNIVHFRELPQVDVGGTDVPHFVEQVVERFHGLWNRHVLVATGDEDVNIGGAESFERTFNLAEQRVTGETALVYAFQFVH
jgi:hypothetical protein